MIPIIAVFLIYLTALTITQNKYYIIPNVLATLHASDEFMTFNFERMNHKTQFQQNSIPFSSK